MVNVIGGIQFKVQVVVLQLGIVVGKIMIEDVVVVKIVGIVVCEVSGVYVFGGGVVCMVGVIWDVFNMIDLLQGISVEVGEMQVVVDVIIVVEYLVLLQKVVDDVCMVIYCVMVEFVGMDVVEVNVIVNDVYIFLDDEGDGVQEV